jgi:carbonic anhydrase
MNLKINSLVLVGLSVCGAHAFADDSMSQAAPTSHQMMKDCIERQKTADVNRSQAEMKRICKDQLKQQKQTGVPAEPPPTDAPHN